MQSLKFKTLFFMALSLMTLKSQAAFNDMDCLNANYSAEVHHKVLWGLSEDILKIDKQACVLIVEKEQFKFIKKKWLVDVCRGPVHIKYGTTSFDVIKREDNCQEQGSTYCQSMKDLFSILQDDGLIFADGEKENLDEDHGKIYCSFLLVKKYLEEGIILGRHNRYQNYIVKDQSHEVSNEEQAQQPSSKAIDPDSYSTPHESPTPYSSPNGDPSSGAPDF